MPVAAPLPDSFLIQRSRPTVMSLRFSAPCTNFSSMPFSLPSQSRQRDLFVAKVAARGFHSDTLHSSLGELLGLDPTGYARGRLLLGRHHGNMFL